MVFFLGGGVFLQTPGCAEQSPQPPSLPGSSSLWRGGGGQPGPCTQGGIVVALCGGFSSLPGLCHLYFRNHLKPGFK